jgi:hypothetical protein
MQTSAHNTHLRWCARNAPRKTASTGQQPRARPALDKLPTSNQAHPTVNIKKAAARTSNSPNLSPNPARTQQSINMTAPSINSTAQQ